MPIEKSPKNCLIKYIAPIVLGMEDALVELTGALAGFTIALGNNRLIALAGLTTGVAATLSMAASEFLSQEVSEDKCPAWKAAISCGSAYLLTVALLLFPFFIFSQPAAALCLSLLTASVIIVLYAFFVSKIRSVNFFACIIRMICISFGVAAIAFTITWLARMLWGVDI